MGNFTYDENSSEVVTVRNNFYSQTRNDPRNKSFTDNQIWAEMPSLRTIADELNGAAQQRKQNYRSQVYNLYLFLVNEGHLQASVYNAYVDNLMNNSHVEPFAQAIAGYHNKKELVGLKADFQQKFPGSQAHVDAALNGNPDQLANTVSNILAKQEIIDLKARWVTQIKNRTQLEANFEAMGLGKSSEIDLTGKCHWIPASMRRDEGLLKASFVYGGVLVKPSIMLLNKVSQQVSSILLASSIALTPPSAYGSFLNQSNQEYEIHKAENLVREVQWEISQFKMAHPFVKVDTFEIDQTLFNLNQKISFAKYQTIPTINISPKPKVVDPFEIRGFKHTSLFDDNIPVYEIYDSGLSAGLGYSIMGKMLDKFQKQILKQCHPATLDDLNKETEENSIFTMTPSEVLEWGKATTQKAKETIFWKFFERNQQEWVKNQPEYILNSMMKNTK